MIRLLHFTVRHLLTMFSLALALVALLAGATQLLVFELQGLLPELEALISEQTHLEVRIHSLQARLRWLKPQFYLAQVHITEPGAAAPLLQLPRLDITFDTWGSLKHRRLQVAAVSMADAEVLLQEDHDGQLHLGGAGVLLPAATVDTGAGESSLLAESFEMRLENTRVRYEFARGQSMELEGIAFKLRGRHQHWRLEGRLPDTRAGSGGGQFRAEIRRDGDVEPWGGAVYLELGGQVLADYLEHQYQLTALDWAADQSRIEIWAGLANNSLQQARGRVDLRDLHLRSAVPGFAEQSLNWPRLAGDLQWQRRPQGWELAAAGLTLGDPANPPSAMRMELRETPGQERPELQVAVDRLRATPVLDALALFWPQSVIALQGLKPQGDLTDLRWRRPAAPGEPWQLQANVAQLAWQSWTEVPAVQHLNGQLRMGPLSGILTLDAQGVEVDYRQLFRWPLWLERLQGALSWRLNDDGLLLQGRELAARNADITTTTDFDLRLPLGAESVMMTVATRFRDGDASSTFRYLPAEIMPDDVVDWLDRALISGRVTQGLLWLHGTAEDFPYEKGGGHFEVLFDVEDAVLDYAPGWPRLDQIAAQVRFLDNSLEIQGRNAHIFSSHSQDIRVDIARLDPTSPLQVATHIHGPFADVLRILRESPLADTFGHYVEGLVAEGNSSLQLHVELPLEDEVGKPEPTVSGRLQWERDARLRVTAAELDLEQLQGALDFDMQGLRAPRIQARIWGEPARIEVSSREDQVLIDTRVPVTAKTLGRFLPKAAVEGVTGRSDFRALLRVPKSHERVVADLDISSDLKGLTLRWPSPFDKAAETLRPLRLSGPVPGQSASSLQLRWGDLLAANVLLDNAHLRGVRLRLGQGQVESLPAAAGHIELEGKLEQWTPGPWLELWKRASTTASTATPALDFDLRAQLEVGTLALANQDWTSTKLELETSASGWLFKFDAPQCAGVIERQTRVPGLPVHALLTHCDVQGREDDEKKPPATAPDPGPDPRGLPPLLLDIDHLTWHGLELGQLQLRLESDPRGLLLTRFVAESPLMTLAGRGDWLRVGSSHRSRLELSASGPALGNLVKTMGDDPHMREAPFALSGELQWPGALYGADWPFLSGELRLALGAGAFEAVEPGVARVLGGINVGMLGRRLAMDFTDLFSKGFEFDEVIANFEVRDDHLWVRQLAVNGPAARGDFTGQLGLSARDMDLDLTLIPRISGTLPVAGYLSGNLAIGTALLLVQQLMGSELDKLASTHYRVTGSWRQPEAEKVGTILPFVGAGRHSGSADAQAPSAPKPQSLHNDP